MVFSLKSGSTTVANLSPYRGLLDVISNLGVDLGPREQRYRRLLGELLSSARSPAEKRAKIKLVQMFYTDVMKGIDVASRKNPRAFKASVFNLFRSATFGTDLADVIDVDKTKIKRYTLIFFRIFNSDIKFAYTIWYRRYCIFGFFIFHNVCLLYTSDAADE